MKSDIHPNYHSITVKIEAEMTSINTRIRVCTDHFDFQLVGINFIRVSLNCLLIVFSLKTPMTLRFFTDSRARLLPLLVFEGEIWLSVRLGRSKTKHMSRKNTHR